MQQVHGPADAAWLVVLAPGDQGRASDPAPSAVALGLAQHGVRVVSFDSPPILPSEMCADERLAEFIRGAVEEQRPGQGLVLGGFSRGARVSAGLVRELGASGLLVFAYPFHGRHDPDPGERAGELGEAGVPVLLFQGTRDAHGNRQQVRGYRLPSHVDLRWLEDANHALRPRARSGQTQEGQLAVAVDVAGRWLRGLAS